jgi:ubiquinone/menaquinone biosynthesis C-methylase UbiE
VSNSDKNVVKDFGEEWNQYPQDSIEDIQLKKAYDQYFNIFPFNQLPAQPEGFDMGCGSGRWAKLFCTRVYKLNCIDPSNQALSVAKHNLASCNNINFINSSVEETKIEPCSQDFGYCLGVLHHIPDTLSGLKDCSKLLKPGAPFLLYLYYKFDNKPIWFRFIYHISNIIRVGIVSKLPFRLKVFVTFILACLVYFPVARLALLLEKLGLNIENFPLMDYRNKSFYFMKTDSLDRFGTKLEKRFSKKEIENMLKEAGFTGVSFSEHMPKWVCISYKE